MQQNQPDSNQRVIIVGCGSMSRTWVRHMTERSDTVIVAFVDPVVDAAEKAAAATGNGAPVFKSLAEALGAVQPDIVCDITIPAAHREVAVTALEAGCDVFAEKPMADSLDAARAIVDAARSSGRSHAVMQNRRYNANIRAYRSLVLGRRLPGEDRERDGIGRLGILTADFFLGPHFGGFRDAMQSPLLLDMAIHTFDQARFISGANAVSVYCLEHNPIGSWYAGNAAAFCTFRMSDGSIFSYRGSWCAEGASTSWESYWRAVGEHGTAIWNGADAPYAEIADSTSTEFLRPVRRVEAEPTWTGRDGHDGCLDEMFAARAAARPAETDGSDNIHSIRMVFAAIESARTGREVSIEET